MRSQSPGAGGVHVFVGCAIAWTRRLIVCRGVRSRPGPVGREAAGLPVGPAVEVGPWGEGGQDEDGGDRGGGEVEADRKSPDSIPRRLLSISRVLHMGAIALGTAGNRRGSLVPGLLFGTAPRPYGPRVLRCRRPVGWGRLVSPGDRW